MSHRITVAGELDVARPELSSALSEALDAGASRIVVDLLEVSFIDSSVLRNLLLAHRDMRSRGGWIRLAYSNLLIGQVMGVTGLAQALPRYPSDERALDGRPALPGPPGAVPVTPGERSVSLAADLDSVTVARHSVRDAPVGWGLGSAVEDASLAVTELIANAVEYARSPVRVAVAVADDILVSVWDAAHVLEPAAPLGPLAENGHGVQIVAAVSCARRAEPEPSGKCLWFRLPLPDGHATRAELLALAGTATDRGTASRRTAGTAG